MADLATTDPCVVGHYWAEVITNDAHDPIALVCVRCSRRIDVDTPGRLHHTQLVVSLLDAALYAITLADDIDAAQGIAHAALHREEYDDGG